MPSAAAMSWSIGHVLDESGANVLGDVDEGLTLVLGVDEVPDEAALGGRQGLEQVADLGRVERLEQLADWCERAALQGVAQAV